MNAHPQTVAADDETLVEVVRLLFALGFDTIDIAQVLRLDEARVWNLRARAGRRPA
ncbi:hypothetical protein [Chelatococcus sp. XZ-Ab1]|uniref:hypothetical protein n=1 Tax=Chelatococcus sp. XZ-Ab1 TaxID=3034027 RepID=UPI0023E3963B|nr:hypothetical protein [Chelatococcus sp. XZ-Ab1]